MRARVLSVVLAFVSFWTLGASWATPPPDPAGVHAYLIHERTDVLPLVIIIAVGLLVALLIAIGHRKAKRTVPEQHL